LSRLPGLGRLRLLGIPADDEGCTTSVTDDLAYATATELAARIRRRDLSPVELLDAVIARIEARNPSLNALVFTAFEEARDRARQAERALTSGEAIGPLHGVPTAIKDLFDFKPGWPATFGGSAHSGTSASLPAARTRSGWRPQAPSSSARRTAP
jgi:Asp-tRNA(Asn)/Glu-tRNA(Gln) amidotransferase A subunit family amidase